MSKKSYEERKKILKERYGIELNEEEEEEVKVMCTFSIGVYENGRQEGIKIGEASGAKKGSFKATLKYVKNMLAHNQGSTVEEVMDMLGVEDELRPLVIEECKK